MGLGRLVSDCSRPIKIGREPLEGLASVDQPLVTAQPANRPHQDRGTSGPARPPHLLPDGGGFGLTESVPCHPEAGNRFAPAGAGVTKLERAI